MRLARTFTQSLQVAVIGAVMVACIEQGARNVGDGSLVLSVRHPLQIYSAPGDSDYVMGSIGNGRGKLFINGVRVPVHASGGFVAYLPVPRDTIGYRILATLREDTIRADYKPPAKSDTAAALADTRLVPRPLILASSTARGPRLWSVLASSQAEVLARAAGRTQVAVNGAVFWVEDADAARFPTATVRRRSLIRVLSPVITSTKWGAVIEVPTEAIPATRAEFKRDTLVIFMAATVVPGTQQSIATGDSLIRSVAILNNASGTELRIALRGPIYGYRVSPETNAVIVKIRRPPEVTERAPLLGLTVVVDAGHPPGGAVGPTGLEEREVTLAVAALVATQLRARGATVVMTRTGPEEVSLVKRVAASQDSLAHAFVSIHVDGAPQGSNPYSMQGSATFAFNGNSYPLAAAVHDRVRRHLQSSDRGIRRADFAVLRTTWVPAVLCEALTITLPENEALLRTSKVREQYALGVTEGLESYFRALGAAYRHYY